MTINPYLSFKGNCEEAFLFYQSVFGGEFPYVGRFKDMPSDTPLDEEISNKIMHIVLPISKETILKGSDTLDNCGTTVQFGNNVAIAINAESEEEAIRVFNGLSEGGTVTMPLEKTFWGALFGMFTDAFGIHWMINYDYESKEY